MEISQRFADDCRTKKDVGPAIVKPLLRHYTRLQEYNDGILEVIVNRSAKKET
jgi:hypothetical protein